jgi:type I restriction enzyme M protein
MNIEMHGGRADLGAGPPKNPREIDAGPGQYDVVLMNAPFNMTGWCLPPADQPRPWPYGAPPEHNANFAWLQLAVEALDRDGRAVVMMPSSATVTQNPRERDIRNAMVDSGVVRCVVALPGRLFRETTSAATLWILGRPDDNAPRDILLVDAQAAAHADGPTHRVLTAAGSRGVLAVYRDWLARTTDFPLAVGAVTATTVTIEQVQQHGYDLHPTTYLHRLPSGASEGRPATTLPALRDSLDQLNAAAKAADLALDHCLERLGPWTR